MRLCELHTVPVWQESDGSRTFGMCYRPNHPPVVGWCNVALIVVAGEPRWFALTLGA